MLALADTIGEIEATRTVHMFQHMQKLDEERKAAEASS